MSARPSSDAIGRDDALELGEDALGGDVGDPGRARGRRRDGVRLGLDRQLAGEARDAQRAQGVVVEARRRDHPQAAGREVVAPPWGSTTSPPASGSAIALMVKSRMARSSASDVALQRRDVDLPAALGADDPPCAERV